MTQIHGGDKNALRDEEESLRGKFDDMRIVKVLVNLDAFILYICVFIIVRICLRTKSPKNQELKHKHNCRPERESMIRITMYSIFHDTSEYTRSACI